MFSGAQAEGLSLRQGPDTILVTDEPVEVGGTVAGSRVNMGQKLEVLLASGFSLKKGVRRPLKRRLGEDI